MLYVSYALCQLRVFMPPDVSDLRCALICHSLAVALPRLLILSINMGHLGGQEVLDGLVKAKLDHSITLQVLGR